MSAALIRLDQVTVTFAGQDVLDNIELSVEPGQIVTLIGPNGAGKTRLVKAVLGLLKPTHGSVWRKPRLRVGYMPQKLHVDPTLPLSVLRFLRLVPGVDRPQALAALKEVGAEKVIDSPVQSVSGGEMQRVLLARTRGRTTPPAAPPTSSRRTPACSFVCPCCDYAPTGTARAIPVCGGCRPEAGS